MARIALDRYRGRADDAGRGDVGDGGDLYREEADYWVFAVAVAEGGGGERA